VSIVKLSDKIWWIGGLLSLITACHTNHLSLDYKVYDACYADSSSTEIAFILRTSAYFQAKGISRFPDGGVPKYVYHDISLFELNIRENRLNRIASFNDLTEAGFNIATSLKTLTIATDSAIYFRIRPITPWSQYLKWSKNAADSAAIISLKNKYATPYKINLSSEQMLVADSLDYEDNLKNMQRYDLTYLHKKLDSIPLIAVGLDVMKINPKSENSYIEETIYLDNSSPITRRAVIEQIISKQSKDKINELLDEMDRYKQSLEGLELTEYEIYSKDVYRQLRALL
jgi:hypothetical protein